MFKRQFYALEHSNRGDSASSSSSSSLATASDGEGGPDVEDDGAWPASSHESDSSSEDEVVEAGGFTSAPRTVVALDDTSDDVAEGADSEADGDTSDIEPREVQRTRKLSNQWADAVDDDETERVLAKFEGSSVICVGAGNQVFKCRLCPKVVCLSEESMEAHLTSKGHARSVKQLSEGRLQIQLDSEGEEEEEGETHAERYARTITTAQEDKTAKRKRDSGRQRQRKRMKRKALLAEKETKIGKEISRALLAARDLKKRQTKSEIERKKSKSVANIALEQIVAKNAHMQPPKSWKKKTASNRAKGKPVVNIAKGKPVVDGPKRKPPVVDRAKGKFVINGRKDKPVGDGPKGKRRIQMSTRQ